MIIKESENKSDCIVCQIELLGWAIEFSYQVPNPTQLGKIQSFDQIMQFFRILGFEFKLNSKYHSQVGVSLGTLLFVFLKILVVPT